MHDYQTNWSSIVASSGDGYTITGDSVMGYFKRTRDQQRQQQHHQHATDTGTDSLSDGTTDDDVDNGHKHRLRERRLDVGPDSTTSQRALTLSPTAIRTAARITTRPRTRQPII